MKIIYIYIVFFIKNKYNLNNALSKKKVALLQSKYTKIKLINDLFMTKKNIFFLVGFFGKKNYFCIY